MAIALFPGTFDPVTRGHLDLIERASRHFEQVVVAVGNNVRKAPWFTAEQRAQMLRDSVSEEIQVVIFEGLLIDCARRLGATAVVKGVRSAADFDFEVVQASANRELGALETFFLPAAPSWAHVSSSLVRELATWGGDYSRYVPTAASKALATKNLSTQKDDNHA